jgi:octaprenyl-diphosphate synthase
VAQDKSIEDKMAMFGEYTGIAFQIKDDLFDYGKPGDIGKPTGIDIKEKKMTLPLIYALGKASSSDKKRVINIIKNHNEEPERVAEVIAFVHKSGGIEYATQKMNEYKEKALMLLSEFKDGEAKEALRELVVYTTQREK